MQLCDPIHFNFNSWNNWWIHNKLEAHFGSDGCGAMFIGASAYLATVC